MLLFRAEEVGLQHSGRGNGRGIEESGVGHFYFVFL
jgi:hypothetical protein